jgi:hypothetical protein
MELAVKAAWLVLAIVHATPAAVLFRPSLVQLLYGAAADGPAGILLTHRGALFLGVALAAVWAAFDPQVRRLVSLILAVSLVGFLIVYARAGMPAGPLGTIALVDAMALAPLLLVAWNAFRAG